MPKQKKKPILRSPNEYPVRGRSLGKSRGSTQGVAGWRSSYYRLEEQKRDSGDYLQTYLKSLHLGVHQQ